MFGVCYLTKKRVIWLLALILAGAIFLGCAVYFIRDYLHYRSITDIGAYDNFSVVSHIKKEVEVPINFDELEKIINALNEQYKRKGEYGAILSQIELVEETITKYNEDLKNIDNGLFSQDFKTKIDDQLSKFNDIFSEISDELYNERYSVKEDVINNSKGQSVYKFSIIGTNLSSGKKQGEISCFDIAYTLFADKESIPCLHFILNDKKELMHDNQLIKLAEIANRENIQFVASILEDKLPIELRNEDYYVVKLSQNDKLLRIEGQS